MWLFSIGNGAEIWPLEMGRNSPVLTWLRQRWMTVLQLHFSTCLLLFHKKLWIHCKWLVTVVGLSIKSELDCKTFARYFAHNALLKICWPASIPAARLLSVRISWFSPQGGGVLWYFHIFLGGMKIFWIFFWGHHKIGLVWGSFLCNLGSFFKVRVQNWDTLWGC